MEKFGLNQLREMFLSFFESKGHLRPVSYTHLTLPTRLAV